MKMAKKAIEILSENIKYVQWFIPENTDELFIDAKCFEAYGKAQGYWNKYCYKEMMLELGKNVFIFDSQSCDFKER